MHKGHLLIAQADNALSESIVPLLRENGFHVHVVNSGREVLDILKSANRPDLLIFDQGMPDPGVRDVCHLIKSDASLGLLPVILLVPESNGVNVNQIIEAGCGDVLLQPVNFQVLLARIHFLLRLKGTTDDAESILYTLTRTIETKDSYTMGHADRVSRFAVELGKKAGLNPDELETLRKGGMLHDIGKIAIPDALLIKPGKYTPEEFDIMKKHPALGCEICEKLQSVRDALPLIRHHHEKLDGTGYPDGLGGAQITTMIRIVCIVDVYDALRSRRSYKDPFTIDKTFETMWDEANKGWWDKDLLAVWERDVPDGAEKRTSG